MELGFEGVNGGFLSFRSLCLSVCLLGLVSLPRLLRSLFHYVLLFFFLKLGTLGRRGRRGRSQKRLLYLLKYDIMYHGAGAYRYM